MTATLPELSGSLGNETDFLSRDRNSIDVDPREKVANGSFRGAGIANCSPEGRTLPRLLYELALGLPEAPEVQVVCFWLCQPEKSSIKLYALLPGQHSQLRVSREFPLEDSIAGWVWKHNHPLVISPESETPFPELARLLNLGGIKSFCAVPMMFANRQISVITLASRQSEAFRHFHLEFIPQSGVGIARAKRNYSAFQQTHEPVAHNCQEVLSVEEEISYDANFEGILGRSAPMRLLRGGIKVAAPTDSTVLILGETGTGKELIARAVHNLSSRRDRPFVKMNCAAIPSGLIESEFFGHERGAFTGAVGRRIGRFEMADGGTLFLDEIGDIPLELQPKLLRVLQEQEFERLGSAQTTKVNVRVVAATSRDLPRMVAAKEFRGDLYYRLNVFPLRVAPLRERRQDIALLAHHFMVVYAKRMGKGVNEISPETMDVLSNYSFPGNVRELQNIIERAVILSPGKVLHALFDELVQSPPTSENAGFYAENEPTTLKEAEREHIIEALDATGWVLAGPNGASARLGLPRTSLIGKMKRLGITRAHV